jgi:radical SAM protein with 4Fe4S-binding SPASM domain
MHKVLSVDLNGNVRTCPHTDSSFIGGKITDIENARAVKMNPWKEDCIGTKCPVFKLCKGGCPLKIAKHDFLINCGIESIWFEGIQEAGFEFLFKEKVKRITEVNRNSHTYDYSRGIK